MRGASIIMGYGKCNINEYTANPENYTRPTLNHHSMLHLKDVQYHGDHLIMDFIRPLKVNTTAHPGYFEFADKNQQLLLAYNNVTKPHSPTHFSKHNKVFQREINWFKERKFFFITC